MTEGNAIETGEPHGILYADNRSVIVQSASNMGKYIPFPNVIFCYFSNPHPHGNAENVRFQKSKLFVNLQFVLTMTCDLQILKFQRVNSSHIEL